MLCNSLRNRFSYELREETPYALLFLARLLRYRWDLRASVIGGNVQRPAGFGRQALDIQNHRFVKNLWTPQIFDPSVKMVDRESVSYAFTSKKLLSESARIAELDHGVCAGLRRLTSSTDCALRINPQGVLGRRFASCPEPVSVPSRWILWGQDAL